MTLSNSDAIQTQFFAQTDETSQVVELSTAIHDGERPDVKSSEQRNLRRGIHRGRSAVGCPVRLVPQKSPARSLIADRIWQTEGSCRLEEREESG